MPKLIILGFDMNDFRTEDEMAAKYGCDSHELIDDLTELTNDPYGNQEIKILMGSILSKLRGGNHLLICQPLQEAHKEAVCQAYERCPNLIHDAAFDKLAEQVPEAPITGIDSFIDAYHAAEDKFESFGLTTYLIENDEDTDEEFLTFHPAYRASERHTLKFVADGTIELDGAIMRRTALTTEGYFRHDVITKEPLTPAQLLGFIAIRLATQGPKDLVGYGRAFGPGKEDKTNATLTHYSRTFRAGSVVGVVNVTKDGVFKAKADDVIKVARTLLDNTTEPVFIHQQGKEIYLGDEALLHFRGHREGELITLGGKSTKHMRVDTGAYVLYTANGTGTITMPALIGMFEESNDGSIYCDKATLNKVSGYLKETVRSTKDFNRMSEELVAAYYQAEVYVQEGERVDPGMTLYTVGTTPQVWDTKADYGIVRKIVNEATAELVRLEIHIDAYFEGDIKVRGFGKGLVCPAEAARVQAHDQDGNPFKGLIIGAPGIIKDSNAAKEALASQPYTAPATVTSTYCHRDFEHILLKHKPEETEDPNILVRKYPQATLTFDKAKRTVATYDPAAVYVDIKVGIEASPVGQAVGSTSMTMPQLGYLMSLPTSGAFLSQKLKRPLERRVRALSYMWENATAKVDEPLPQQA